MQFFESTLLIRLLKAIRLMGVLGRVSNLTSLFGLDLRRLLTVISGLPPYVKDLRKFRQQIREHSSDGFQFIINPRFEDRFFQSGTAKWHYFHQDLLVARRIFHNNPEIHVDVGSRIDGFVAHLAAFREVEVFDIRPLSTSVPNVKFRRVDLMGLVEPTLINYSSSLSCLHALEHFGLGRYSDPINAEGHVVGLNNFHRILRRTGKFYLSVPIGPQRIEFNAHRVFAVKYLLQLIENKFALERLSYIDDSGDLHDDVSVDDRSIEQNYGCYYGCAILEMTKL